MVAISGNIEECLETDKITECVKNYSQACNVDCTVIDYHGEFLYSNNAVNKKGYCNFCQKAQELLGAKHNCSKVHLYGSYQAEKFGGRYIFFCPLGLVHWASPITLQGSMIGAVLGGPVLMMNPEDFLLEEIISKFNIDKIYLDDLKRYIIEIPIVPPDKVHSLCEMLFMVTAYISDIEHLKFIDDTELQTQQSDISQHIYNMKMMSEKKDSDKSYPIEKERELLSFISEGDKKGAQKVLNEILGHVMFSSNGDFETIKARILELVVLLSRAAMEGGADDEQIFGLNYKYLNEIHNYHTVEQLTFWLSKIMIRFTDCVFNLQGIKHSDVIYKALDFIKRNHVRKISLEEVAAHVYLSPSYFSTLFKREMNCNFNSYLNQKRIETSKKLLLNDNINILEISSLVGFDDQSYFTKVFKKITGMSPGKFRESKGQIKKADNKK